MKIETETVNLLEQILEEKVGNRMEVVFIKPQLGINPDKYTSRGWYIFTLTDLPKFLSDHGVLKINVKSNEAGDTSTGE